MAGFKDVVWIGSSKKDLLDLPEEIVDEFGHGLYEAQQGLHPRHAKPYHLDGGATTLELVENFDTDIYRAVYTVKFEEAIYVLHCFQKKSTQGRETSRRDQALIERRYKIAREEREAWLRTRTTKTT